MNILLVDMSNIAVKNAFSAVKQHPEDNRVWAKWSERTIGDLIGFVGQFNADRCILCMDSDTYWRKEIYPQYKANRRQFKKDAIIDFDNFEAFYKKFMVDFSSVFTTFRVMQVARCEGDDIIACLTKHLAAENKITVVSADRDFNQLLKYPGVVHYDPRARKEIVSLNPRKDLEMKVILGDMGDFIPGIKRGVGPKGAEKLIGVDILYTSDTMMAEAYKRNRMIIDFDFIPMDISASVIDRYKEDINGPVRASRTSAFNFFLQYKAQSAMNVWQMHGNKVRALR